MLAVPRFACLLFSLAPFLAVVAADDDDSKKPAAAEEKVRTVEELTEATIESIVVIYQGGRSTEVGGTGTGFIIEEDGLIATNWHVINEGRPIRIKLHDGSEHDATEVYASDRRLDLALIRFKPDPDKPLKALELGDSSQLSQGQPVVALGNPLGLNHSVVEGVISAVRDQVRDFPFPMIQVAMPVEPGNSGGPIIDLEGRVQGIITLKSMVTENLGFAAPIDALQALLDKPNPIPMDRWATIGALDPQLWDPKMGATWSQRAGRIQVRGVGAGFGGRSLLFSKKKPPAETYELEVEVKLDNESGAAGLLFEGDGDDVHYGFYPSEGRLRLTRFQGPDVYSWEILEQVEAPNYEMGEWNRVKIRVEPEKITCFVNDEELLVSTDVELRGGSIGLCKFRATEAEFRGFRVAEKLDVESIDPKATESLNGLIGEFLESNDPDERQQLLESLGDNPSAGRASLEATTELLRERIKELTRLQRDANAEIIGGQLADSLEGKDADIDLFGSSLLIAKLDNAELDVDSYLDRLDRMAAEIRTQLPDEADEAEKVDAVRKFMFEDSGFHGSRLEYYHESNSFINEVLDDREGLPITLAVVFIELANRIEANTVHGVGLPSHFVVGYEAEEGNQQLLDVFEGGEALERDAAAMIVAAAGQRLTDEHLKPVSKKAIIERMLRNLIGVKKGPPQPTEGFDPVDAMPYVQLMLAVSPEDPTARLDRALLRYQEGDVEGAKVDLRWLLQNEPPGINIPGLRAFYEQL
ncbi:MAG: serine protease Do [Verrucomicrobiales bacterium]|jgi:serine protease Do